MMRAIKLLDHFHKKIKNGIQFIFQHSLIVILLTLLNGFDQQLNTAMETLQLIQIKVKRSSRAKVSGARASVLTATLKTFSSTCQAQRVTIIAGVDQWLTSRNVRRCRDIVDPKVFHLPAHFNELLVTS